MDNTSRTDSSIVIKSGLNTDLNSTYLEKEQYSYARNATRISKDGDIGTISNEPSTIKCYSAPYKILGIIPLPDGTDMVFSGDEVNSEIGIGDINKCSYKKLNNNKDWNFSKYNQIITGVAKKMFNKGIVVTFTDRKNPIRRVEIDKLPNIVDLNETLLFKKISIPTISLAKSPSGTVPNGTYSAAVAYSINNQIFTDWYGLSDRIQLYSLGSNNGFNIRIENLDQEFKEYSLAIICNYEDPATKGATKAVKIIGTFSTNVNQVSISDISNSSYVNIPISDLLSKRNSWYTAGIISANSNYLLLADLVGYKEQNYQLKTEQIQVEYVVEQVPIDYYEEDSRDVGYYRDENYDFYIHGIRTTGVLTDKYHIFGRKKKSSDATAVASDNVYEYDTDCKIERSIERWEVENTAGPITYTNDKFNCGRRILGYGEMGYFESTIRYPNNPAVYGTNADTPQRFHKMPSEKIVPRYQIIDGKKYINILGVRFKNIPKFDDPDIIGYVITRSDRKGGNGTVIARGLMTNVRSYQDQQLKQEVMFSNYPVNDLNPDVYLSTTQTKFSSNKEKDFNPLTTYYKDRFNFYSPHTMFEPKYTLGNEIKIESEEVANIKGKFELVHRHPKAKLLNQFAFWASLAIGYIESYFEEQGLKNSTKTNTDGKIKGNLDGTIGKDKLNSTFKNGTIEAQSYSPGSGTALTLVGESVKDSLDALKSIIKSGNSKQIKTYYKFLTNTIKLIASLGAKAAIKALSVMRYANEIIDIIYGFTGFTDYVYQYNAYATFEESKHIGKRRSLRRSAIYLPSDITTINDKLYNNYGRERSVYLELNKELEESSKKDNSRNTISGFGICDNINDSVESRGVAYYATSKVTNPNQYGKIGSAPSVAMHSGILTDYSETPILYGGDCIITRFQFQKKMQFFSQTLANSNFPDGVEYDYRLYRNIAYPRYWIDTTKYDFSNIINRPMVNFQRFGRTTTNKHNLDCKKVEDGGSITRVDNAYMYTSNNAILDFVVECDYNPNFREKRLNPSLVFRSDKLNEEEKFEINRVYSDIYPTELFVQQQRHDFDPENPIPVNQENSVIYSLPSYNLQYADNWQYFLPLNFFSFNESDFGRLTSIHKMDQDRLIFLFSKSSPFISMGRDFLELEGSGRKVTIGDGGLFAQDPREIMPTDNNYASCNSRFAFSNTHLGRYYPSEVQGRIMQLTDNLDDITRQGISYWCKNYMPIQLYQYFPEYPKNENPMQGVGYLTVFDSFTETVYITKRDFSPIYKDIIYKNDQFWYQGIKIDLHDNRYFKDISWTLSYSPLEKAFISWHDWHPDITIQRDNHFSTVKDSTVWKHNESYNSFCNFYDNDYPFEIEFMTNSGQNIEIARSIEYILEVYKYQNFGRNRFHVHHENFDKLIVHNSEQISPVLNLTYGSQNPELALDYPKINTSNKVSYDILFFKEENKYRVNQFWDATKDRGEFTNNTIHLFPVDESGYKYVVNPNAIDINKKEEERKKFRHYFTKFRFIKSNSLDNKFIVKLLNIKKLLSIR